MRKLIAAPIVAFALIALSGTAAFAHECTNISKDLHNPAAGVQIVFTGEDSPPSWISHGLQQRVDHLGWDRVEATFHGLVGIDFDGNGTVDADTFIVGPEGELPLKAQLKGSPDHGIVNICVFLGCE